MKPTLRFAIAAIAIAVMTTESSACCWFMPPACCISYEMRPVICYRPEWRDERVPCVVQRVSYRREVSQVQVQRWVAEPVERQVRLSYFVPVPREVERDVWRCVTIPIATIDPWTCCPCWTYATQWVRQPVRCIEYDFRREERDEVIRTCRWVQQPVMVEQVRWIPEYSQEQIWTVRRTCVMVPYQTMVCVPVYCR